MECRSTLQSFSVYRKFKVYRSIGFSLVLITQSLERQKWEGTFQFVLVFFKKNFLLLLLPPISRFVRTRGDVMYVSSTPLTPDEIVKNKN